MGHGNSDKLYITHAEHSGGLGEHSASRGARAKNTVLAKLPFDHCALTLKPFETPVCTTDGTVYELLAIIPFIRQHGTDPMTGKKLSPGDLVRLNFARNNDGQYHDPITFKVFNDHTAIAAIKPTGNVYARESIDRLNLKARNLHDLLTDEPFTRRDIITLQDPLNLEGRDVSKFDYVRRALKVDEDEGALSGINVEASGIARVLKTLEKGKQDKEALEAKPPGPPTASTSSAPSSSSSSRTGLVPSASSSSTPYNQAPISNNRTAAAFTSTAATVSTRAENALWDEEHLMYEQVRERGEKGYARMVTNFGALNFELFAGVAPRACYNFLSARRQGYYQNVKFHRLIPGFMLQGGDPTGTGRGGESRWGKPFEDEFSARNAQKHDQRGVLAMANSGPNTNGSQFYVTFRDKCSHLDGKHTVFGRLVGGQDILSKLERVPTDPSTDRPLKPVVLLDVEVFGDPFDEYKKRLEKRLRREQEEREGRGERERRREERAKDRTTWFGTNLETSSPSALALASSSSTGGPSIGKYLSSSAAPAPIAGAGLKRKTPALGGAESDLVAQLGAAGDGSEAAAAKRKKKAAGGGGGGFGDFSAW
ncbi:hypothetical protein DMC30DRAFT_346024 [Rhodotorula diobovata]|uniref:Cyclophilin-like domain-containing protein n=1 Tax=Rhodotorula diobovata TaxID=5288 RepID=A0A5C5G7I2_9BASI|nr:hypothetical protein DMC30DRAFT_346024 [Rhodotorula diobovata]